MKLALHICVFALLLAFPLTAGAQAPAPVGSYQISFAGGYSSTTGNATNNGFWSSLAVPLYTKAGKYDFNIAGRADYFSISNPSTYVLTAGPEFRFQFSKATLLSGAVFQPFANLGAGTAKSQCVSTATCPVGADTSSHAAFKVGGGLDMQISSTMAIRLVEVDYIKSTIFPVGHVTISNLAQISAGVLLKFGAAK